MRLGRVTPAAPVMLSFLLQVRDMHMFVTLHLILFYRPEIIMINSNKLVFNFPMV